MKAAQMVDWMVVKTVAEREWQLVDQMALT